jgi:hypothetical protein
MWFLVFVLCLHVELNYWSHLLITNLASHNLVMEIMQNSFNHNSYVSLIKIVYWKHIWNTNLLEDAKFMWHSFIGLYFIHQHNYMCVKHVFNAWYSYVKCTNLWMNELCMIFVISASHAKFVINMVVSSSISQSSSSHSNTLQMLKSIQIKKWQPPKS